MSVSQHTQRRARLSRAAWLPISSRWVTGSASIAAVLFGIAADLPPAAAALNGVAALSAAALASTLVRRDKSGAEAPAAQWKPYSETLIQAVPTQLPPCNSTFRGRAEELASLQRKHDRWRKRQSGKSAGAPVMIFLHGMAGIGKSAVAQSLAHALAGHYPDGQLYANLGVAGAPRPPAEVLRSFLPALGWDGEAIPASTAGRAQLFRTLTRGKKMLIVLDAARDPAQLRDLMPSEPQCTVIVTSRRDMSPAFGAHSLQLGPLTHGDGLDLLAAVAGQDNTFDLAAATAIVEACGSHPLAVRAAADIAAQHRISLSALAEKLQSPGGLDAVLTNPSRDLRGRLSSEYRQLNSDHQKAFRLLSVVGSRTFVPWVLGPAFQVDLAEAENLLAALASAQLVLAAGRDDVTAIDRYELPPVLQQFAASLSSADDDAEVARARLDEAYLEAAERVIRELDDEFGIGRQPVPVRWLPEEALLPARIAGQGQAKAWVRAEYTNLLRAIRLARHRGDHSLSARIAAWLGGCAPRGVPAAEVLGALDQALHSAEQVGTIEQVDVLLTRGAYRTAIEEYSQAFDDFARALALCHSPADSDAGRLLQRRAMIERRCGEAYLRAGEFTAAAHRFERARTLAMRAPGGETLLPLITTLRYLTDSQIPLPAQLRTGYVDDEFAYWFALAQCSTAVESEHWDIAERILATAATDYHGDLRRAATISYWQSRLHLARSQRQAPAWAHARNAVRAAHRSLNDYKLLDDTAGQVRAHCQLVSAYLIARRPDTAADHLRAAREARETVDPWLNKTGSPLDGLLLRAQAELRSAGDEAGVRLDELRRAAVVLAANGDRRTVAEIAVLTGDDPSELMRQADAELQADTAVRAFVEGGLPVEVGRPAMLRVAVSAVHLVRYVGNVTGNQVTALILAENADVVPRGRSIDLSTLAGDVQLDFELTCRGRGPVRLQVQLHALADGLLLQEFDATLPPVALAAREAA
jgi:tetratricopeptide (TPR) repeat protein